MPAINSTLRFGQVLFVLLCMQSSLVRGAGSQLEDACAVQTPPDIAGEILNVLPDSTQFGRVFPRVSEMPPEYTGCVVAWISIDRKPVTRNVTVFRNGWPVTSTPPSDAPFCKQGERASIIGCSPRWESLLVSYPAGCVSRIAASKVIPEDCKAASANEWKIWDELKNEE